MARLFGALQTKEIRDEKVLQLTQRIAEDESKISEFEESLKYAFKHRYIFLIFTIIIVLF